MSVEGQLRLYPRPFDHAGETGSAEGRPTLRGEHEWTFGLLLASEPAQGPQLVPHNRMDAGGALLDSANVQGGRSEGHLFPAHLMPERDILRLKPAVRFEWQSQHGKERPYSAIIALRRIGLSDPDNFFGSDSPIRPTI